MKKIIIHCSATPNGREHKAEDIHRWHLNRGWSGIGYHYVIPITGNIEVGRPHYWHGSHALNNNANSLGVCVIGTDAYSESQWHLLKVLVTRLMSKYPSAKVIGHNEVSAKTCPGFDVQDWLSSNMEAGNKL
jgi:N-acetyl-anhydromuramyl-L-alanine amidase AmpD